jgi:uncharacterized protein YeaO (DUF488 family)
VQGLDRYGRLGDTKNPDRPADKVDNNAKLSANSLCSISTACSMAKGALMAIRIVRLGSPRKRGEGMRIGTVRRPPRGVPKAEFAARDFYDVWLPALSPEPDLLKLWLAVTDQRDWLAFSRKFRNQMALPDNSRLLDLLAALSHQTNLSVGCYCEDEARCHRSILRALLGERGAEIVD